MFNFFLVKYGLEFLILFHDMKQCESKWCNHIRDIQNWFLMTNDGYQLCEHCYVVLQQLKV